MSPPDLLQGTPYKSSADGRDRFSYIKPQADRKRKDHCGEMAGLIVGPMKVKDYLEKFTRISDERDLPPQPDVTFDNVPLESANPTEDAMYQPLIDKFKLLMPRFQWFQSAQDVDSGDVLIRPDISCIEAGRWPDVPVSQKQAAKRKKRLLAKIKKRGGNSTPDPDTQRPYDWKRCEFPVEVKRSVNLDAFTDNDKDTVESRKKDAHSHRGQLISYVKEQMSRQHRTGMHEVFICGDYARLLFFDRSCGVVTERFDYHKQPELLAEFLWRYNHMDQVARGWDASVIPATDKETEVFVERVGEFVEEFGKAPELNKDGGLSCELFASTLAADYPTFKIELKSSTYSGTLIIRRPFFEPSSPIGRATRGYVAYDMESKEIVFLKDTWRTEHTSERMSEPEVYRFLKSKGVAHIPEILYAADVQGPDGGEQRTLLDQLISEIVASPQIRPFLPQNVRSHVHCRIVQRLAFPLSSFRDSKELVRILRDTLLAIKCAYDAGILHRDISLGNVMIAMSGLGILNDWDHSRELELPTTGSQSGNEKEGAAFRTGTWQFMSIRILRNPDRRHTVLDDVESVYWLLLYSSVHWLQHSHSGFEMDMFDEVNEKPFTGMPCLVVGGVKKKLFLVERQYGSLKFQSQPLNELLQEFARQLTAIYLAEMVDDEHVLSQIQAISKLKDLPSMVELFNKALERTDWPENDRVADQYPRRTETQETREDHRNTVSSYSRPPSNFPSQHSTESHSGSRDENTRATDGRGASRKASKRRGASSREVGRDSMRAQAIIMSASTSSSTDFRMISGGLAPNYHFDTTHTPIAGPSRVRRSTRSSDSGSIPTAASTSQESSPKRKSDVLGDPDSPSKKSKK